MYGEFLDTINNWQPEIELTVKARFIQRGTNAPVTGEEYTARLYDKDLFSDDDYLGHAQLDANGEAHIHFFPTDLTNHDLGFERLPDLYILLFKDNLVHFQTKAWDNVDFEKLAKLDKSEGQVLDFGTFLID
ncbi:MAG TPA: hypothetical protein VK174_15940 [Chitinophagales bacterium]|nr:hypothetical protein [Chitinophagales bacterium]